MRNRIRAVGARLLFLTAYSPDLNPIEQVSAKLKHLMRNAAKRTLEDTWTKARGVRFGTRPTFGAEQNAHTRQLIETENKPVAEIARLLGVHRTTLHRALDAH